MTAEYNAFTTGENAPNLIAVRPGRARCTRSPRWTSDDDDLMPPKKSGGPLKKDEIETAARPGSNRAPSGPTVSR